MSMGQCCATGSLHTGTPTGRMEKLHGLDVYIAEPPADIKPKGVVVIIPDAFGVELPNNRILADAYAKEGGFKVLLPGIFVPGTAVPASALLSLSAFNAKGLGAQFAKIGHALSLVRVMGPFIYYNRPSAAAPKVYAFLQAVKQHEAADLPLGVAGFCWGGYFVTKVCSGALQPVDSASPPIVACGFTAHPSFLKYPNDVEGVKLPYAVAAAENDIQMSKPNAKVTREILERKNRENLSASSGSGEGKAVLVQHEFILYEGVHHGFAVRADEDAKLEAEAGKKAEAQAIAWFTKWFAQAQAAAPSAAAAALVNSTGA